MTNSSNDRELELEELVFDPRMQMTTSRIAIADDDPACLEMLRIALRSRHTEICEAVNGAELGRLLAEKGPFDLVVTDIHMPWMQGLQVLRSARAAEISTPVLVVTGLTQTGLQAKIDSLGNAKLLLKPFGIPELRAAISDLMAGQLPS